MSERISRHSVVARYLWSTCGIRELTRGIGIRPSANAAYVGNTSRDVSKDRLNDSQDVVDKFFEELPQRIGLDKSRILFVIDGMRPNLYTQSTLNEAQGSYFDLIRLYFMQMGKRKGYEVIDMQPKFIEKYLMNGERFEFPTDSHWNSTGHHVVAESIASSSVGQGLLADPGKEQ